jgi:predicted GNAT superfamily acetyltransferase
VQAIGEALDKQMAEDGTELFTDKRENVHLDTTTHLDFDALIKEFNDMVVNIPGSSDMNAETEDGIKFKEYWQPRISQIIEKYLGKGHRIKDATRDQVEAISLIVDDMKELVKSK